MKPRVLIQLDTDAQPSVFDAVVAIDAGVEHLLRHGGVTPDRVAGLVHGAIFTRGPADLHRTAIFVGGSDVGAAEAVLQAVRQTFFGPFRVSILFDPNGSNTTAAAAVRAIYEGAKETIGQLEGAEAAVLGATGPVGQRVARLLLRRGAKVALGSRSFDRAQRLADQLRADRVGEASPFAADTPEALHLALQGKSIVVAAGAAGAVLLPASVRKALPALKVVVDLNAVPPLGVEGIEVGDKKAERDGVLAWGAIGVGGTKMKVHRKAVELLFTKNDLVLDAEELLEI
jgi:predicted dinucleotide-binding enzyme